MEPQNISVSVWLIATLFGGVGAALFSLIAQAIRAAYIQNKTKKNLRREIHFNMPQVKEIKDKLSEFKEDYVKIDRANQFHYFFYLKTSRAIYNHLFASASVYDYLDDDQLIKIDNVFSESQGYLNEEIEKIKQAAYDKNESINKLNYFISRYQNFYDDLNTIAEKIK